MKPSARAFASFCATIVATIGIHFSCRVPIAPGPSRQVARRHHILNP
jgi:hypothetical protein